MTRRRSSRTPIDLPQRSPSSGPTADRLVACATPPHGLDITIKRQLAHRFTNDIVMQKRSVMLPKGLVHQGIDLRQPLACTRLHARLRMKPISLKLSFASRHTTPFLIELCLQ